MAFSITKKSDTTYKISMTRGDSLACELSVTRNGEPYTPVDGDVIRFAMKKHVNDENVLIEKIIPNDTLQLIINPEDTKNLPFGEYRYDVQITFADGFVSTFITDSPFELTSEVD